MDMDKDILVKLEQGMKNFTRSEKKIAKYVLENPEMIMETSITDLAKSTKTSEASIVRFCKSMGLDGFKDFKITISWELSAANKNKQIIHEKIKLDDNSKDILEKVSLGSIKAIEDTKKVLDIKYLEKAVKEISQANNIYLFGIGSSGIVAMDFQFKLMKINMPAFAFFDKDMQLASSVNLQEGDIAIAITETGKTRDIITALKVAKEKGAKTITITQYGKSPILEFTDIPLFTACVENIFESGGMASRVAQLNLVDVLFMQIASKKYDQVIDNLEEIRQIVEDVSRII